MIKMGLQHAKMHANVKKLQILHLVSVSKHIFDLVFVHITVKYAMATKLKTIKLRHIYCKSFFKCKTIFNVKLKSYRG